MRVGKLRWFSCRTQLYYRFRLNASLFGKFLGLILVDVRRMKVRWVIVSQSGACGVAVKGLDEWCKRLILPFCKVRILKNETRVGNAQQD